MVNDLPPFAESTSDCGHSPAEGLVTCFGILRWWRWRPRLLLVHLGVQVEHVLGRSVGDDTAVLEQNRAIAHLADQFVRMGGKHHDARSPDQSLDSLGRARGETRIARAESLVQQKNLWIEG